LLYISKIVKLTKNKKNITSIYSTYLFIKMSEPNSSCPSQKISHRAAKRVGSQARSASRRNGVVPRSLFGNENNNNAEGG
jgi:hypothetical protein